MRVAVIAIVVAATTLLTACGSGPTLTDGEALWCNENQHFVHAAQQKLGLKSDTRIWLEDRGVTFDAEENALPSEALDAADEEAEYYVFNTDLDIFWEWSDTLFSEWLEHPDGIQACKTAYENR